MGINTRIHDRRKRLKQQQANLRALKEREIDEVIAKAVKRFDVGVRLVTPEARIQALDKYISDLREIGEEMDILYGPGIERRLWLIAHEIDKAIEAIAKLKMDQVEPRD